MQLVLALNKEIANKIVASYVETSSREFQPIWQFVAIPETFLIDPIDSVIRNELNQLIDDSVVNLSTLPVIFAAKAILFQRSNNTYSPVRDAALPSIMFFQ